MAKNISNGEYNRIATVLSEFLKETTASYDILEPWNIINKYFVIDKETLEDPIIDIRVGDKLYSLGTHSTLDITDAKNFIVYMRVVCRNLLIGPKRAGKY